jgi:hypothetical protein
MKLLVLVTALLACSRQPKPSSGPWIARVDYSHYVVDRARVMAFLDRKPLEVPGVEPDPAGGLVVRASDPEWARAGLRDGDRIVEISGLPVRSLDDVKAVIRRLDGARALILGVSRAQHVVLHEYRFGDPSRDAPFSDPEIHSLADVVRKYWVTRVDDEHYQVDLAALGLLALCAGPPLSVPGTAALKSKLPFATDADACEAIGVKRGDKLVTLDGKTIASGDDFLNVVDGEGDHVAVELERAGGRVHLSYAVRAASRTHPGEPLVSHPEILLFASHPSAAPTGPDATAIARHPGRPGLDGASRAQHPRWEGKRLQAVCDPSQRRGGSRRLAERRYASGGERRAHRHARSRPRRLEQAISRAAHHRRGRAAR